MDERQISQVCRDQLWTFSHTGPYSNRKLTNVVWAEFGSTDIAQTFCK